MLISLSASVFAQQQNDTTTFWYCEIVGTSNFFRTSVTIEIDYGQSKDYFEDNRLKDEQTGKVSKFNSMVDALNFMSTKGWIFENAYSVTYGNQNVYHYLLRRKK